MGKFSLYNVPLRNLSEGNHDLEYYLDDQYFGLISDAESDIKKGKVSIKATVKRIASTFEFNFSITGYVTAPCDRCLDELNIEIETANKLIVKFGQEYSEESDEIVIIPEEEGEINIAWFLYEFISLSTPIKKIHAPGKCNKTMSSKLNKHKAVSLDDEDSDEEENFDSNEISIDENTTDPRWDALKGLNDDDQ